MCGLFFAVGSLMFGIVNMFDFCYDCLCVCGFIPYDSVYLGVVMFACLNRFFKFVNFYMVGSYNVSF